MAEHNDLGKIGEEKATEYLLSKGYLILNRNWHFGKYELDIVAEKDNILVVVEVKTRRKNFLLHPKDSVNITKIRNTVRAAESYIFKNNIMKETRFDIVSVVVGKNAEDCIVEHIEDAFLPLVN